MMLTLIVSLAIVTLGVVGLFNFNRVNRFLDDVLKGLTKMTREALKYALAGLLGLLWVAALYSVYDYAVKGFTPTLDESLDVFVGDIKEGADYAGKTVKRWGDDVYADVRGLYTANDQPQEPGHASPADTIEHKMGPNVGDVMSNFEVYHTPRFHTGGDECSRTIKDTGNCWGVSRFFTDGQHINQCNKLFVRAPQSLPFNGAVKFAL